MNFIITYPTALQYWLKTSDLEARKNATPKQLLLDAATQWDWPLPLHIAVASKALRQQSKTFRCHVLPKTLPAGSVETFPNGLQIISPELCFLLAAKELSIPELVVLANDLCAIYINDHQEDYGQKRRIPATSVEKIAEFLHKADKLKGLKKARIAIQFALNRSNSPIESKLAAIFRLPLHYGGYNLLQPILNYDVILSREATELFKSPSCCCDFYWPNNKVIAEYDSTMTHLTPNQHFKDSKRKNALTLSGYTVITVTAEDVTNFGNMEKTIFLIRKTLNMREYKDRFQKYNGKRYGVFRTLFWNDRNIDDGTAVSSHPAQV